MNGNTRNVLLVLGMIFACCVTVSKMSAQKKGAYTLKTTEYIATDINGQEVNIGAALKSGKKVFLDVSTVWCNMCWILHHTGHLQDLYALYGPEGTDEFLVLWVEDQGAKPEQIRGEGKTKGDWTIGGSFPVPIVSDPNLTRTLGITIKGWPTGIVLFPDGSYDYFSGDIWKGAKALYQKVGSLETSASDVPVVHSIDLKSGFARRDYHVSREDAIVFSRADVTAIKWAFEGGTPTAFMESGIVVWDKPGKYKVTLTATNRNGESREKTQTIEIRPQPSAMEMPCEETFESHKLSEGWYMYDADGDGYSWNSFRSYFDGLKYTGNDYNGVSAFDGKDALVAWSFRPYAFNEVTGRWSCKKNRAKDYLFTPAIRVPQDAPNPIAYFWVKSTDAKYPDFYTVLLSTKGQSPSSLSTVLCPLREASAEWKQEIIDLSPYKGQEIFLALLHEADGYSGIVVDNFGLSADGSQSSEKISEDSLSIRVAGGKLYISGIDVLSASLYSLQGKVLGTFEGFGRGKDLELDLGPISGPVVVSVQTPSDILSTKLILSSQQD